MKMKLLAVCMAIFSVSGCAHNHGVVGPATGGDGAEVGVKVRVGSKEVKEGEEVYVFESVCRPSSVRVSRETERCKYKRVGKATVRKVLDSSNAIVSSEEGLVLNENMTIRTRTDQQ